MEKGDESRAFQIALVLCVGWAVETPPTADAPVAALPTGNDLDCTQWSSTRPIHFYREAPVSRSSY